MGVADHQQVRLPWWARLLFSTVAGKILSAVLFACVLIYFAAAYSLWGLDGPPIELLISAGLGLALSWEALLLLALSGWSGAASCVLVCILTFQIGVLPVALHPVALPAWFDFVYTAGEVAVPALILVVMIVMAFRSIKRSSHAILPRRIAHPRIALALALPLLACSALLIAWVIAILPEVATIHR